MFQEGERQVVGVIWSLENGIGLRLEYANLLHEGMLVGVLMQGNEPMVWEKKKIYGQSCTDG